MVDSYASVGVGVFSIFENQLELVYGQGVKQALRVLWVKPGSVFVEDGQGVKRFVCQSVDVGDADLYQQVVNASGEYASFGVMGVFYPEPQIISKIWRTAP